MYYIWIVVLSLGAFNALIFFDLARWTGRWYWWAGFASCLALMVILSKPMWKKVK